MNFVLYFSAFFIFYYFSTSITGGQGQQMHGDSI